MSEKQYKLLVSEDEAIHRKILTRAFNAFSTTYTLSYTETLEETKQALKEYNYDCVISDIYLPDGKGTELLTLNDLAETVPVVILTGQGNETIAAETIKAGAAEYIVKSEENFQKLPAVVDRTIREWKLKESKKKAEKELSETKERLNRIVNTMAEGLIMVDKEGQIVFANPAARTIVGLKRDSIVGKYYFERDWRQIDTDGNPLPEENLPLAIALGEQKEALEVEHGIVAEDGKTKWLSVNAFPLFNGDGELDGAIASFRDITKRKKAEEELEKSLNFYLTLFDQLPNPKLRTDSKGECNYVNTAWTETTGRPKEREMGDLWMDRLHPDERDEVEEKFIRAFSAKKELKAECRILHKSGEYHWFIMVGRPFNDLEGNFAGYIITLNDITEQKKEEEYLYGELERELNVLESVSSRPQTSVTAQSLGLRPLKESLPVLFDRFVQRFINLLNKSFEQRTHKTSNNYSLELKQMSQELGRVNVGPRDIIEIYTTALREKSEHSPVLKAQAYAEDGRLMALELMGNLTSYYRNYYIRSGSKE